MKSLTIAITLLLTTICNAQVYVSLAGGYSDKSLVVNPALGVNIKGAVIQGEFKALTSSTQPALFGLHAGYQYKFIETGYGGYMMLYSADKYDSYKNKWVNGVYIRGYIKNLFLEYQHTDKHFVMTGIKIKL